MLREIIKKEVLDHMMGLRFSIACVLCFIVIVCSLFVRQQDFVRTVAIYNENSSVNRSERDQVDHPWRLVWLGIKLDQPPNPLKIFVRGIEDQNGYSVDLNCQQPIYLETAEIDNPLLPLFPSTDLMTFVGIIMSLLAVIFAYDTVSGEKERGTLRLMLSYSVPRDIVLLGKWIGGYVTLVIPFIIAVVAAAAIVLAQSNVLFMQAQWLQFMAVCLLSLLYIAVVYSAAIWISCLTSRSSTSIMLLVTLWLVFVLAIPNLSPYLAQAWKDAGSSQEMESERSETARQAWEDTVTKDMTRYDNAHGIDQAWWRNLQRGNWASEKVVVERTVFELDRQRSALIARLKMYRSVEEKYTRLLDAQISLSQWISRLSPFSCYAMAATELTDTGIHGKRRFMEQLEAHQIRLCEYSFSEWIPLEQYRLDHDGESPPSWTDNRAAPPPEFVYARPAGSDYLKVVAIDIGILSGMLVVFFMMSYLSFLKYDVR